MMDAAAELPIKSGYVSVNGLEMYYEIQGAGPPLVLMHGGLTTIDYSFAKIRPTLARSWTTIAMEQQAHGHTADIDREITYEHMADDTAALLRHLNISNADVFGWSDGGNTALQVAIRHPDLVRKVAVFGSFCRMEALYPEIIAFFARATIADFGDDIKDAYFKASPRADGWVRLVEKTKVMTLPPDVWSDANLSSIKAPVLFMVGDADIVKPEHAVDMFRLIPQCQLAVLPGTNHFAPVSKPDFIFPMAEAFFKAPMPKAKKKPITFE